jgi:hypothetical protein
MIILQDVGRFVNLLGIQCLACIADGFQLQLTKAQNITLTVMSYYYCQKVLQEIT